MDGRWMVFGSDRYTYSDSELVYFAKIYSDTGKKKKTPTQMAPNSVILLHLSLSQVPRFALLLHHHHHLVLTSPVLTKP